MNDIKVFVKDNWVYIVGGIIGLYLILRFAGSGSNASGSSDLAAFYNAQAQAGMAQSQLSLQSQAQQAQIDSQNAYNQQQYDLAQQSLALARDSAATQGNIDFLNTQSTMAQAIGASASQVMGALYAPGITAMQSSAAENAATLQAAAGVAAVGYQSQSAMVSAANQSVSAVAQGLQAYGPVAQAVAGQQSPLQTIAGVAKAALLPYGFQQGGGLYGSSLYY